MTLTVPNQGIGVLAQCLLSNSNARWKIHMTVLSALDTVLIAHNRNEIEAPPEMLLLALEVYK